MYSTRTGLVLGFHGCDQSLANDVIGGKTTLRNSKNSYDWLGHGIYMWDSGPSRAIAFAESLKEHPGKAISPIKVPAVIGSVINLGFCLDLLDFQNLSLLKDAYGIFKVASEYSGVEIPKNKSIGGNKDLLLRELDCGVVEMFHQFRRYKNMLPYDSVRGVFSEGSELYKGAGFKEKDHIQICIRNPNCIKGYFLPMLNNDTFNKV